MLLMQFLQKYFTASSIVVVNDFVVDVMVAVVYIVSNLQPSKF